MGQHTPMDETLAFTALLELDPDGFGKLGMDEATAMRRQLQEDFYASDAKNLLEYAKGWLAAREMAAQVPAEAPAGTWDEPEGAVTPRGWLRTDRTVVGFYLDYGSEHYRSPHGETRADGQYVQYCQPGHPCGECQPGNVLAVRYSGDRGTAKESRYVKTIDQARQFVERGGQAEAEAEGVCREPGANGGRCGLEAEHAGRHLPVHMIDQEQPQAADQRQQFHAGYTDRPGGMPTVAEENRRAQRQPQA